MRKSNDFWLLQDLGQKKHVFFCGWLKKLGRKHVDYSTFQKSTPFLELRGLEILSKLKV